MSKLRENIDRILGNSIRCLLPSYWWKRIFGLVIDEVEKMQKTANKKADKSYVDNALKNVTVDTSNLVTKDELSEVITPVKYTLYVPSNNEELADVYKQKNKEVVSVALKGGIQPSQIKLVFQNGDGSNVFEGLYLVNQLTASLENNQGILVLYAIATLQVFNDGVKGGELKLVFKSDGSARWSEVVAKPRPVVYIPLPDSTKQVTSSQKADNLKMFDILNAVLKNNRDELPDLILSVQNSSYDSTRISVAPNLYYRASGTNADGQQVEGILFIGTFTDSKIISAALYSDGTAKANLLSLSAEVTSDTALSTTSENPLQNKVVTAELAKKQDVLVSGETIKTINGNSILGSGDITFQADVDTSAFATKEELNALQTEVINNEEVTAAAINDLNTRIGAAADTAYVDNAIASAITLTLNTEV
jgi:hypothetical protein